jgi:membrane carboxypeptidase/penicillin-binding protein
VWVGYDNARGKQTLGRGSTGGHTAVPIVEPIIQATWNTVGPKTLLPAAIAGSRAAPQGAADRFRQWTKARGQQPRRFHRVFQARRQPRRCGTLNIRWPAATAWRRRHGPRWEAVPDRAPRRT